MHESTRVAAGIAFLLAIFFLIQAVRLYYRRKEREAAAQDQRMREAIDAAGVLLDAAATRDWTDRRPIESMPFGMNETIEAARESVAIRVRAMLRRYDCLIADDINKLGCTGIMAKRADMYPINERASAVNTALQDGQFLRLGLAGGGVGLPCFVPSNRYCFIHQTIGGLQEGQVQLHDMWVGYISRELTPDEMARVIVVEKARRVQPGSASPETTQHAADLLAGRKRGEVVEAFRDFTHDVGENQIVDLDAEEPDAEFPRLGATTEWTCVEHKEPRWECRYCVAQLIVEGELVPEFVVDVEGAALRMDSLLPEELAVRLQQESAPVTVFVRAKTVTKGSTT